MAKKSLPLDTIVDVVARKENKVIIKTMPYEDAIKIEKKKDWKYSIFQVGFHSYKENI